MHRALLEFSGSKQKQREEKWGVDEYQLGMQGTNSSRWFRQTDVNKSCKVKEWETWNYVAQCQLFGKTVKLKSVKESWRKAALMGAGPISIPYNPQEKSQGHVPLWGQVFISIIRASIVIFYLHLEHDNKKRWMETVKDFHLRWLDAH